MNNTIDDGCMLRMSTQRLSSHSHISKRLALFRYCIVCDQFKIKLVLEFTSP